MTAPPDQPGPAYFGDDDLGRIADALELLALRVAGDHRPASDDELRRMRVTCEQLRHRVLARHAQPCPHAHHRQEPK